MVQIDIDMIKECDLLRFHIACMSVCPHMVMMVGGSEKTSSCA